MEFEWDEEKRERAIRHHGVDFEDILPIWNGFTIEKLDARKEYGETRLITYGDVDGFVFVVVYTERGDRRRIISARRANKRERRAYYAALSGIAGKGED